MNKFFLTSRKICVKDIFVGGYEMQKILQPGLLPLSQFGLIQSLSRVEARTIACVMIGMLSRVTQLYQIYLYDREQFITILIDFSINRTRKSGGVR